MDQTEIEAIAQDRFAWDYYGKEAFYRREKQWKIFAWSASVLLAAMGGVIGLAKSNHKIEFWSQGVPLGIALLFLSIYAVGWISKNIDMEESALGFQDGISDRLHIVPVKNLSFAPFGYGVTLTMLTIISIIAIFTCSTFPK